MVRLLLSAMMVLWFVAIGLAIGPGTRSSEGQVAQSVASSPDRLAQMRHHFSQVSLIHEALIRGAMESVQAPAAELSEMATPPELPPAATPFVEAIRLAARRAVGATTLEDAATATASMLTQCGQCHRALGVPVALVTPDTPDVGGIVGHMLEHQRAVDELLQGLFVPSASRWIQGAERLRMAPLRSDQLPRDPNFDESIRSAEARVHQIAVAAEGDGDANARSASYVRLVTTCAECHSLHSRIWGPDRQTTGAGPVPASR